MRLGSTGFQFGPGLERWPGWEMGSGAQDGRGTSKRCWPERMDRLSGAASEHTQLVCVHAVLDSKHAGPAILLDQGHWKRQQAPMGCIELLLSSYWCCGLAGNVMLTRNCT